jgi:hypothetical protein
MVNSTNGHNGNGDMAGYIKALLMPTTRRSGERRAWSIGVESVWVPFFLATNVAGETALPSDVLGMPLRLAKSKDGAVRFSNSGRPVLKVAPELNAHIGIVRENFVAGLQSYTGMVQQERPDDYKAHVEDAQRAALPIAEATKRDIEEAILAMNQDNAQPKPAAKEAVATAKSKKS